MKNENSVKENMHPAIPRDEKVTIRKVLIDNETYLTIKKLPYCFFLKEQITWVNEDPVLKELAIKMEVTVDEILEAYKEFRENEEQS